ncbi:hypothetical protein PIB30_084935 [Stylosanthes scabra]|uniref:Uncharacterized protein n=1 Tax=Stylosanthes scabra TaxID=79078 RepID=A0ABU6QV12_9FABA|nr:hypothetical protein [Stylosanthes scabra]
MVFQHAGVSTMSELEQVFLFNIGGGFREIHALVGKAGSPCAPPVAATPVRIAELSVPGVEMEMDNTESHSDYVASYGSSSNSPEDDECIPDTPATGVPVISCLHRIQFHVLQTCLVSFSSLTWMKCQVLIC